jgi:hypothetical protein
MKVIPLEKNRTRLEYEIYARKGLDESTIQEFITFMKQVEKEVPPSKKLTQDYDLCIACQKNLNVGVYFAGALQPDRENGTLFYQSLVKKMVLSHLALEKERGEKINPAYAGLKSAKRVNGQSENIAEVLEMEKICRSLDICGGGSDEELW